MESRSSHFLVGLFVLIGAALIGIMGVWFAKADIDRAFDTYDVVFTGSVNGLQEGAVVKLRGVPVGRVQSITIDDENIEEIIAMIEIDGGTPIKEDTRAVLALQGVTGLANIELRGGSRDSSPLEVSQGQDHPRIITDRSAIEKVFDSTPELLANSVALLARLEALLSNENLIAINGILEKTDGLMAQLSDPKMGVKPLLENATAATQSVGLASSQARVQLAELDEVMQIVQGDAQRFLERSGDAMDEGSRAAASVSLLAAGLSGTIANLERPLDDFSQSGLYDFTEMVRELRQLVASMTRITKEFERDPAGFLIGGNQRGFTPQ